MKVLHAYVYGISHFELGKTLEKRFKEETLPVHLASYDNFSVVIVEKYEIILKADIVGVIIIREMDERKADMEIVVCGIENFTLQKAEKSMAKYLSRVLKTAGKERNLEVVIQEQA